MQIPTDFSFAGTMGYIPPEAMSHASGEKITSEVLKKWDVYSFAVLMCYTLSGKHPFAGMSDAQIMVMVLLDGKRPRIPDHVDVNPEHPVFKQMIQRLWQPDPLKRDEFSAIVDQLREHVADPNLKHTVQQVSTSRQFLRTLQPLLAGAKNGCVCRRWVGGCY